MNIQSFYDCPNHLGMCTGEVGARGTELVRGIRNSFFSIEEIGTRVTHRVQIKDTFDKLGEGREGERETDEKEEKVVGAIGRGGGRYDWGRFASSPWINGVFHPVE